MTTDEIVANHGLAVRVFRIVDTDDLQVDSFGGLLRLDVLCSDFFWWGTTDHEAITLENIGDLEQAMADADAVDAAHRGPELFVARIRKMRPQGAVYDMLPQQIWPLFDACGPKREKGIFNPKPQPDDPEVIR